MEKEEILLQNLKEFKEDLIDLNRTLIFICDIFLQKKEEFEEENNEKLSLENNKYTKSNEEEIKNLQDKINECLKENDFENYFDLYRECKSVIEFIEQDLALINSCFKMKIDKEILIYNYSKLDASKKEVKLILDNLDNVILKVSKLKK